MKLYYRHFANKVLLIAFNIHHTEMLKFNFTLAKEKHYCSMDCGRVKQTDIKMLFDNFKRRI